MNEAAKRPTCRIPDAPIKTIPRRTAALSKGPRNVEYWLYVY